MPKGATTDFTFSLPSDWIDKSMITWVAPNDGKRQVLPNILCSKDVLPKGQSLEEFVNRQLQDLMTKVENFDLVKRETIVFQDKPAVQLVFCMKPQEIMLQQRQVFFKTSPNAKLVHTMVATAAKADFADLDKTFANIFNSVSWTV